MNMNRNSCKCCRPVKKKKKTDFKKIGAAMRLLGAVTVSILLLPLKCWVMVISFALILCGVLLIKK